MHTQTPTHTDGDRTEADERKALVGYCDKCEVWSPFTLGIDPKACPNCGSKFSNKIGLQITTQRTFNPKGKKVDMKKRIGA